MSHRVKVKVDGNQHEIVDALFAAGFSVQALQQGMGVPDLLVAKAGRPMALLEVKRPGEKMTDFQTKWAKHWPIPVHVVHDAAEALSAVGCAVTQ